MTGVVADTYAVIWYLLDDSRLSRRAGDTLDSNGNRGPQDLFAHHLHC